MKAHKRHIVMKLSLMDKCSIKRNNLFDVTVEAIIDFMNDLMSQLKSSQSLACFCLQSFLFVEFYFKLRVTVQVRKYSLHGASGLYQ